MSPRRDPSSEVASAAVPRGCTSFKLRQLTRRVGQHYDRIVAGAGLKTTQYSLLAQIERLAPVRPSDLAAAMEMDASTLTRNLQPLVANGWVATGPGADARSRLVTATPAGRAKRSAARREWKRAQLALNERLGAARVAELHALLDDCLAALSAEREEAAHA
jgi:DNA-binding MarR family transcriptional regulator